MYAHLLVHKILDVHCYIVVVTEQETIDPNVTHTGNLVSTMEQAFAIAEKHNAPLMEGGDQLLEGDFGI